MVKRILKLVGVLLLVLVAVQAFNTVRFKPQNTASRTVDLPPVDSAAVAVRLGQAIRFQTISKVAGQTERGPAFQGFIDWLVDTYPAANRAMTRVMVGGLTPIYRWEGSDKTLKPILLTAHYDLLYTS